tara:strand:+ start:12085 stop:14340 length:2256 start_codon:yes stop_codon:yes gene_type:complete
MAVDLPAGAAGIKPGNKPTPEAEEVVKANEKSFWQSIADLPGGIYAAATGEGIPIEFPNIPETTDMGDAAPGFFEAFMMNNKLMFARDDFGKVEIMEDTFGDDERWGGAFVDKFDNPMIVWNDKPYYVNKPGFSGQDIGTLTGEIIKFAPASKFVSGAKNLGQTVMRGTGAYSATEVAGQAGEAMLTPETTKAKDRDMGDVAGDVGVATGLGVAVDVVAPPVIKGTSKVLRAGTGKVSETAARVFPRFEPKNIQTSKYPLTVGQRTAALPDRKAGPTEKVTPELESEDVMRRAPGTNPDAANIMRGFDERQLDEIRADATALGDEFGSGRPDITGAADVPTAVAEEIQSVGVSAARDLKARAGKAYDVVQGAEFQPVMDGAGVVATSQVALDSVLSPQGLGITARELGTMPILKREIDYLKRINKLAQNPKFKGSPLNILHGYQKTLNRAVRTAEQGSPEQLALGKIKETIDKAVFDGIEMGFITGDETVLNSLKEATDLYRQYIGLTGKATGKDAQEKSANRILQMITNENFTPKQVVNAFFGHAKFNPNQSMALVLNKLKAALPEDQYKEVVALAKDAVLEKAFSGSGKSGVTRTNIVNNYDDIFVKNKAITGMLFGPDEIARISQFRDNVMPTLWAEIKLNPSNSGYTVLSGLARNGLLNYARLVPIVGRDSVDVIEGMRATGAARDATRQYLSRVNMPLFTSGFSASVRPTVVEEVGEETTSPSLQSIVDSAPASVVEKLNQAANIP